MGRIYRSTDRRLPQDIRRTFASFVGQEIIRPFAFDQAPLKKAFEPAEDLSIEGYANFAEGDRWGEVISPEAWPKRLGNYKRNPIILREHDRYMAVGTCDDINVKADGLYYKATIGRPKVAPLTECQVEMRSLLAQRIIRTNSVGFKPFELEWDEDHDLLRYTDVELLEISLVAIPMQQDSLIEGVKGYAVAKSWRTCRMAKATETTDQDLLEQLTAQGKRLDEALAILKRLNEAADAERKALDAKVKELETKLETELKRYMALEGKAKALYDKLVERGLVKPVAKPAA